MNIFFSKINFFFQEITSKIPFIFNHKTGEIVSLILFLLIVYYLIFLIVINSYLGTTFVKQYLTTKNICYMSMLISISVVVTVIFTFFVPLMVLPPLRISVEGLMIKIAGYIFNPLFGIICALITDIILILFIPSYVDYYYIFSVVLIGFFAGTAGSLNKLLKKTKFSKNYFSFCFFLVHFAIFLFFGLNILNFCLINNKEIFVTNSFSLSKFWIIFIFIFLPFLNLVVIYGILYYFYNYVKNNDFDQLITIILFVFMSEILITFLVTSYADLRLANLEKNKYGYALILRLVQTPFKLLINVIVVNLTIKMVKPLIKIKI
jgi:riboflavin transporter